MSVDLRRRRMRRNREVTIRRRNDAGSKFRSPLPAMRRFLKFRALGSSLEMFFFSHGRICQVEEMDPCNAY